MLQAVAQKQTMQALEPRFLPSLLFSGFLFDFFLLLFLFLFLSAAVVFFVFPILVLYPRMHRRAIIS